MMDPPLQHLRLHFKIVKPWLPVLAFASGVGSFVLVHRQDNLAGYIACAILVCCGLILAQHPLQRLFTRVSGRRFPPMLGQFALQFVHQEMFFFVLPFFFMATAWATGQAFFMVLLGAAGIVSIWDPWYYKMAGIGWLYMLFHALAVFVITLTALPIIFELTTGQSYIIAVVAVIVVCLMTLPQVLQLLPLKRRFPRMTSVMLVLVIAAGAWWGRVWVPPATLRLNQIAITDRIDAVEKLPGEVIRALSHDVLHSQGLYAYTAIRAPRGLRETVSHSWLHEGRLIDRIPMDISGGREDGYRAWTHKLAFPADARGAWQVRVHTDSGQLIGMLRFRVD